MIYYFENKQFLEAPFNFFFFYTKFGYTEYTKLFTNQNLSNITFLVDIECSNTIDDSFYTEYLKQNSIIFIREHKISVKKFADTLIEKIKTFNINPKQIYVILGHNYQLEELNQYFRQHGLTDINTMCNMPWLHLPLQKLQTENFQYSDIVNKKFSIFSRRYVEWRRNLYCDLLVNNILQESHYTFSNLHPDFDDTKTISDMLKNLPDYLNNYKQQITEWFTNSLKSYNFDDPYNSKISYLMQDSAINIALETHIFEQENGVTLTEKIYKPILLKRPFIVYGMPNILSMLRKEGFRTFDGIIDESYDNIIDPDERRLSLVKEIVRLNNLNKVEFEDVLKKCASICNYNSEIVDYYCKKKQLENFKNNLLFGSK